MKKILVPIDFSKDSMHAFEFALEIARSTESSLKFIHVRKQKEYANPFVIQGLEKSYEQKIIDFCNKILKEYKSGTDLDYLIRNGKIYKEVVNLAKSENTDLIVMGTHGVSGFEEFWMGSNSYKVVVHSSCPVLTVRYGFKQKKIRRIILPIDAVSNTRQKIPFTADIAAGTGAMVYIVEIRTTKQENIIKRLKQYADQAENYLLSKNITVARDHLFGSDFVEMAINYATHNKAQLISIVSARKGSPLTISSVSQLMVNHSPIPILTVPPIN